MVVRSRQRGQSIVEFGLIALLFTLLVFAVIDFGLLLNTWLSVSSGTRDIARSAAVGKRQPFLQSQATALNVPSIQVGAGKRCCDSSSAVEVDIAYFQPTCPPWQAGCVALPVSSVDPNYPFGDLDHTGSCTGAGCHPQADDIVLVTVIAHGAQVVTPLVRPFFGCSGSQPVCQVPLQSSVINRFEGVEF